jgi:hypothetical protein
MVLDKVDREQIILNILQIFANVAEEPRGRKFLLKNLGYVEKYFNHTNKFIEEQAQITKDIITWVP